MKTTTCKVWNGRMGTYEHERKSMDEEKMLTNVWNPHVHSTRKVIMESESLP